MSDNDLIYEIVSALAAADGVAPRELDYDLLEFINPEALANMLAVNSDAWDFTFQVPGHEVTITAPGEIYIDGTHRSTLDNQSPTDHQNSDPYVRTNIRRHQALLSNVPCMLYRSQNQRGWPMEFVSDACKDLTGYDPNAFVIGGVSYGEDVIHPDDRQRVWETVQEALQKGETFSHTYRILTAESEHKLVWDKGLGVTVENEVIALVGFVTIPPKNAVDEGNECVPSSSDGARTDTNA